MKRVLVLLFVLGLLVGCGPEPTPEPDLVATQVAVMKDAAATLTAEAPAAVAPTAVPTATATEPPAPVPTATSTLIPVPTATRPPSPTPTQPPPPVGPSLGRFAVVDVYSDDVLNVRARPGVEHPVVGTIPYYGRDVDVRAGGQEISGSWWVPVQHAELSGWLNSNYLARQVGWVSDPIAASAAEIIMTLKDRDMEELAGLIHPDKGVRFSPYTFVQAGPDEDLVFTAAQVRGIMTDPTVYYWGAYDGSGDPIDLTFSEYYDRFVYDVNFSRPDVVGFDEEVGWSSMINNIADVYPQAVTVEYHFEGFDPQYAGLDWRSLRLVLEEQAGTWYLVGIVHDEWTT